MPRSAGSHGRDDATRARRALPVRRAALNITDGVRVGADRQDLELRRDALVDQLEVVVVIVDVGAVVGVERLDRRDRCPHVRGRRASLGAILEAEVRRDGDREQDADDDHDDEELDEREARLLVAKPLLQLADEPHGCRSFRGGWNRQSRYRWPALAAATPVRGIRRGSRSPTVGDLRLGRNPGRKRRLQDPAAARRPPRGTVAPVRSQVRLGTSVLAAAKRTPSGSGRREAPSGAVGIRGSGFRLAARLRAAGVVVEDRRAGAAEAPRVALDRVGQAVRRCAVVGHDARASGRGRCRWRRAPRCPCPRTSGGRSRRPRPPMPRPPQVGLRGRVAGAIAHAEVCGDGDREQHADDDHDDEELDQREAVLGPKSERHSVLCPVVHGAPVLVHEASDRRDAGSRLTPTGVISE